MNVGKIENLYDSDNSRHWRQECVKARNKVTELENEVGRLNKILAGIQTDKKPYTCE